jgi:methionyl-tRNA formyltransferase
MKLGIILTPDIRSKAYIQKIISNSIKLDEIIFMNDGRVEQNYAKDAIDESRKSGFDISKSVKQTLLENNCKFKEFNFIDINNPSLVEHISNTNIDFFIFTGGGILRDSILDVGPKFVHFHPGIVPQYKGSTCFYYSIIRDNNVGVTSFIMNKGIDTGDIVYQRVFPKPNHIYVDDVFDPYVRSETLIDVIKNQLLEKGKFKQQNPNEGEIYYIIHPVLKHIAILSCIH